MKCLIADDEPLARAGLERFVKDTPFLSLVSSCSNGTEVIKALQEQKIDLMFLDIHMPKLSGINLLKSLSKPPLTIITTAYQNYALEGYELSVTDYLVKPFSFERFLTAANKAKSQFDLIEKANGTAADRTFFFVKSEKNYVKIFFDDILHVSALQNYSVIYTVDQKFVVYLTLKSIENELPPGTFIKVNRSEIVNTKKITGLNSNEVLINEMAVTIGRSYREQVMNSLLNHHLLKR
ncbi:MAG: response regulator transcription factor [Bacteroidia bacterium]|nr:response regulator transcription factor [Bacteroidia bacterium]